MGIEHIKVGSAGLVDGLRDFNVRVTGDTQPGRRAETLERVGLGRSAGLADAIETETGRAPGIARDGLVLATEVAALAQPEVLAKLGVRGAAVAAELPRLAKLVERPAAEPLALTPAFIEVRREVSRPYDPSWVELAELPPTYRAMATRVIDTLDALESASTGREEHTLAYDKKVSTEIIDRFLALSDLELATYEPGPRIGAAGQRRVAEKLRAHIEQETHVRDLVPSNPRPVMTRFPVSAATVRLATTPVPDYEQVGRNRVHNLNRALLVDVPAGHTVIVNAQAAQRGGATDVGERVLGPTKPGQPHELDYLPGVADGQPAEVWITVLKGKDVVANQVFAVPANPIGERVTRVEV
ncbi:hypothetical protein L6R52_09090 [Myxococcota bacterium]|nr:hypothetical protein [Myxococcota bacterium]